MIAIRKIGFAFAVLLAFGALAGSALAAEHDQTPHVKMSAPHR